MPPWKIDPKISISAMATCGLCLVNVDREWQLARFGCCSMGFCRECLPNVTETCPGCRQEIPKGQLKEHWGGPIQRVPLRPFMWPNEKWDDLVNLMKSDYHNPVCVIDSNCCSEERSSSASDLCRWHRARMATVYYSNCRCGPQILSYGDSIGRRMFNQYYGNFPCISFSGTYCCSHCNSCDDYVARCGSMAVCEDCLHFHNPANLVATTWDEEHRER